MLITGFIKYIKIMWTGIFQCNTKTIHNKDYYGMNKRFNSTRVIISIKNIEGEDIKY